MFIGEGGYLLLQQRQVCTRVRIVPKSRVVSCPSWMSMKKRGGNNSLPLHPVVPLLSTNALIQHRCPLLSLRFPGKIGISIEAGPVL
jgi:hypothetical protein